MLHMRGCVTRHLFSSNNFAASAALAQVCALLSTVLIVAVMSRFHEHDVHKVFAACVTLYRSRAGGRPDWLTEPMELPSGTPADCSVWLHPSRLSDFHLLDSSPCISSSTLLYIRVVNTSSELLQRTAFAEDALIQ